MKKASNCSSSSSAPEVLEGSIPLKTSTISVSTLLATMSTTPMEDNVKNGSQLQHSLPRGNNIENKQSGQQYSQHSNWSPSNKGLRIVFPEDLYFPEKDSSPLKNNGDNLSWRQLHMSRAKLKATATTSELLSGFAMVAMVELQINEPTNVPEWLFILFAVCTTILVAVHILALMISTYVLPNIDAISKSNSTNAVNESPHDRMRCFIELAWGFSTVLGLFLFMVDLAILCWVKFWDFSMKAAMAATIIVVPALVIFILFALYFHRTIVIHKCKTASSEIKRLEIMTKKLNMVSPV